MKKCNRCFILKPLTEFYKGKGSAGGRINQCRDCKSEDRKIYYAEKSANGQECNQVLRRSALDILGNKCVQCGFSDIRALQIDHIDGGGCLERKAEGYSRRQVERKIVRDGNISDYQLLCANCNWIKKAENNENNNYCPGRPRK